MKRSIASFVALGMLLSTTAAFAEDIFICRGSGAMVRIERNRETSKVKATYPDPSDSSKQVEVEYTATDKERDGFTVLTSEDGSISTWLVPPVLLQDEGGTLVVRNAHKFFGLVCSDATPDYPIN